MINIFNLSFVVVGLACILFGLIFAGRKRARIFYGVNIEGKKAVVAGICLAIVGVAVIVFGVFVFPNLIDLQGIMNDVPELRSN